MKPACGVVFLYAGEVEEGMRVAQDVKERLGAPALDLVAPMPYLVVQQLLDAGNPPGRPQYWKSENLKELSDGAIEALITHANRIASPFSIVVVEPKGERSSPPARTTSRCLAVTPPAPTTASPSGRTRPRPTGISPGPANWGRR